MNFEPNHQTFTEYLERTRRFFHPLAVRRARSRLFIDCASLDGVALDGMLRIAMALSHLQGLAPVAVTTRFGTQKERAIFKSFGIGTITTTFGLMLRGALGNAPQLLRHSGSCATAQRSSAR